jgi:hypothetical protein
MEFYRSVQFTNSIKELVHRTSRQTTPRRGGPNERRFEHIFKEIEEALPPLFLWDYLFINVKIGGSINEK